MSKWVIVLITDAPYFSRVAQTIQEVREEGRWQEDIVLLISHDLENSHEVRQFAQQYHVKLHALPQRDYASIYEVWAQYPDHADYEYIMTRRFIYMKFYLFDMFFKAWDIVFYMDGGMKIQGCLRRFVEACKPDGRLLAHSDAYPYYEWKLHSQFCPEFLDADGHLRLERYDLNRDYFQSGIMIYDTTLITEDLVDSLFSLALRFPCARRTDQAILNLYFNCEKRLWTQIPVRDEEGFLYDFWEREGHTWDEYAIVKARRSA